MKIKIINVEAEQVRIVLFKECMFRESQLLFDSHLLANSPEKNQDDEIDISSSDSRVGTVVAKNNEEFNHLTEMIFGSTAMKYQETYYKMHNVSSPERIIFTQVFVPRRRKSFRKISGTALSRSITKRSSSDLLRLSNSDSSESSLSGLSEYSSRNDSFSIFRRGHLPSSSSTSTTIDSGFSEISLASSSSLSHYGSSFADNGSSFALSETSSADFHNSFNTRRNSSENYPIRTSLGNSRLGLALILVVASDNDRYRDTFIQHTNFVESILWRLRQYIEIALYSPRYFVSLMLDISINSANWLLEIANGLGKWTKEDCEQRDEKRDEESSVSRSIFSNLASKNILQFFQNKLDVLSFKKSLFLRKEKDDFDFFCELLKELDTKETNFFLSTLLTALLTHHTGWISTCYTSKKLTLTDSYNALWRQLMDLQGSTAYFTKTSKTVIYGLKDDSIIIKRILEFLRYFIRCIKVQKRDVERLDIAAENRIADEICDMAFGRISESSDPTNSGKQKGLSKTKSGLIKTKSGLIKTQTVGVDLSQLAASEDEDVQDYRRSSVIFILGDDERLENLKRSSGAFLKKPGNKRYPRSDSLDIVEEEDEKLDKPTKMKIINFPLPKVKPRGDFLDTVPFELSLTNSSLNTFVPDMVIQGTTVPESEWKPILKTDLSLSSYPSYNFEESVVVLGNMSKWEVQIWSSNRNRMYKGHLEESADASRLLYNILEVVLKMWEMNLPKQCCTTFMEQRLMGICLKASTLAEFLLSKDFCSIDLLVSALNISPVDVPLLMSVVSTLYPEVSEKYGFSYQ
ncbi:uncharacterized protein isoform X2 [Leptinotarsa decemlineata]|uniref:uncharacterized protein isoform X2 n=1 Tax=Leptinotarsa decemlineata TaxID=7539 RepID=UPI003D30A861